MEQIPKSKDWPTFPDKKIEGEIYFFATFVARGSDLEKGLRCLAEESRAKIIFEETAGQEEALSGLVAVWLTKKMALVKTIDPLV